MYEKQLKQHTQKCNAPDDDQKRPPALLREDTETNGGIRSGDQHKDHHVIQLFQDLPPGNSKGVIGGACPVKQDQTDHKNAQSDKVGKGSSPGGSMEQDQGRQKDPRQKADQVGQGASGIFDRKSVVLRRSGRTWKMWQWLFQGRHLLSYRCNVMSFWITYKVS